MDKEIRDGYLRVTNIISPFSGIEFVPEKYLEPASLRGSLVHHHIQNLLAGFETPVDNDQIKPYLNSFARFWEDSLHAFQDGKIILEKRLFCDEHKFTGAIDCIISTPDKTFVFDWKTSKNIQDSSWRLQAAAYRYLLEIDGYTNISDLVFVKLDRDGKDPTLFTCDNYNEDLERFFNCLDLYRYFKMDKTRNKWRN